MVRRRGRSSTSERTSGRRRDQVMCFNPSCRSRAGLVRAASSASLIRIRRNDIVPLVLATGVLKQAQGKPLQSSSAPNSCVGLSTWSLPETVNIAGGAVSRLGRFKSLYPMHTVYHVQKTIFRCFLSIKKVVKSEHLKVFKVGKSLLGSSSRYGKSPWKLVPLRLGQVKSL